MFGSLLMRRRQPAAALLRPVHNRSAPTTRSGQFSWRDQELLGYLYSGAAFSWSALAFISACHFLSLPL